MKYLLLLLPIAILAQVPGAPTNLRIATSTVTGSIVPVPVTQTNGQFIASWYPPPSIERTNANAFFQPIANYWLTEVSIDGGASWAGGASETVLLPPREVRALRQPCSTCLHFITVNSATDQVRIRLVAY